MISAILALAQFTSWPQTKAEATDYAQTSSHAEVLAFLDGLKKKGADFRFETIGNSPNGKQIPLVVVPNLTPSEAKAQKRLVIYIQANIHAGEVEGKEASLMMLRELAQKPHNPILKNAVFLFVPIYNCDGNDAWGPALRNRGHQDGPDPVGERANGQGFDLNRDCIKAESPEFRGVLTNIYGKWDPHVVFDLHTTNGTRHGFLLTYSPALNPTTDPEILSYSRNLLDEIRRETPARHGWKLFDYGDAMSKDGQQVFSTFASEGRYVTNYAGLRNRIAILSEAASFQPFKDRVMATRVFVWDCLDGLVRDRRRVMAMTASADAKKLGGTEVGVSFELDSRGPDRVFLEDVDPDNRIPPNKAPIKYKELTMPVYDRFKITKTAKAPASGFVLPAGPAVHLLARHGITVTKTSAPWKSSGRVFVVEGMKQATSPFQGHRLISLSGSYQAREWTVPVGYYYVPMDQPLALLVCHMLMPESTDGVAAWGFLGEEFAVGSEFPVYLMDASGPR